MKRKFIFISIFLLAIFIFALFVFFIGKKERKGLPGQQTTVGGNNSGGHNPNKEENNNGLLQGKIVEIGENLIKVNVLSSNTKLFEGDLENSLEIKIGNETEITRAQWDNTLGENLTKSNTSLLKEEKIGLDDLTEGVGVRIIFKNSDSNNPAVEALSVFVFPEKMATHPYPAEIIRSGDNEE